jgi:hypothetical protein
MKAKVIFLVFLTSFLLSIEAIAQDNILKLKAPQEVAELWKQWGGKYVLYVHKKANVSIFGDLDGMELMVAWINSNEILGEAQNFVKISALKMNLGIQNNPSAYDKQFLENAKRVGIMLPEIAKYYKFDQKGELLRLEFE